MQALATLDGDFDRATPFLLGTAAVASLGPYGQASAVQVVGPPKGPFGTITSYHESHDYELTMNHIVNDVKLGLMFIVAVGRCNGIQDHPRRRSIHSFGRWELGGGDSLHSVRLAPVSQYCQCRATVASGYTTR